MKIIIGYPPFYDRVIAAFPEVANQPNVIFTYGDIIYNPMSGNLPQYIIEHEKVHSYQQKAMGKDEWWDKYLVDAQFRFDQELEAYRKEYKYFCKTYRDMNQRDSFLRFQALMLSSPMYGNLIPMREAMKRIRS